MTSIIRALWVGFAGLSILWLAADPGFFSATGIFQWRHFLVQYSGVLAMGCMSIAMILSLRPRWPEQWLGGLDKMYRLHKWLGIGALVVSISHWFFVNGVKWPVAYLVLVFHSVVLAEFYYWLTPLGIVLAVMMAAGTYAAIISLMGRIGVERRVQGTIADLHSFPGVKVLRTTIDMGPGWPGHKDGAAATKTIHLFHSTAEVDDAALQNLDEEARAANIQLHVLISARDGYLTGDRIRQAVPEWPEASFWFCGPAGFGAALVAQFSEVGKACHDAFRAE